MLLFTREQLLAVFVAYNEAVWPAQVVLYLLALWMVIFIIWPLQQRGRVVAAGLAAMWLWTGVACQGMRHWTISAAAWGFVELFVIQGLLFIEAGVVRGRLAFGSCQGWACWLV